MPMPTSKREYDSLMSALQNQVSSGGVNAELAKSQMSMLSGSKYAAPAKKFAKGGKVDKAAQKKVGKVMHEFKTGALHSGKKGPLVKSRKQAIAIAMSEAGMKKPVKKATGGMVMNGTSPLPPNPRDLVDPALRGRARTMALKKIEAEQPRVLGGRFAKGGAVSKPTYVSSVRDDRALAGLVAERDRLYGTKKYKKGGMVKKGCK